MSWNFKKAGIGYLIAMACVYGVIGPFLFVRWRGAAHAFAEYRNALLRGDLKHAYAELSPETTRTFPYESFSAQQHSLEQRFGPLKSVKSVQERISGDGWPPTWTAQLEVQQVYQEGMLLFHYNLRLENGRWVLSSYQSN